MGCELGEQVKPAGHLPNRWWSLHLTSLWPLIPHSPLSLCFRRLTGHLWPILCQRQCSSSILPARELLDPAEVAQGAPRARIGRPKLGSWGLKCRKKSDRQDKLSEHLVQEASQAFVAPHSQVVHPGHNSKSQVLWKGNQATALRTPSQPAGAGFWKPQVQDRHSYPCTLERGPSGSMQLFLGKLGASHLAPLSPPSALEDCRKGFGIKCGLWQVLTDKVAWGKWLNSLHYGMLTLKDGSHHFFYTGFHQNHGDVEWDPHGTEPGTQAAPVDKKPCLSPASSDFQKGDWFL